MLEQLQGYDYDPTQQPDDEPYPEDSVSQIDYTDDEHYQDTGTQARG